MNAKKLLCMVMAMLIALSAAALAETDTADLQAALDEANARIAELEAEVELYRPFYESQVVAEYGDGGIIWLKDAQADFDAAANMYSQYGISIDAYADQIKQSVLEARVQEAILNDKAVELGLDQLDDETLEDLAVEAEETFGMYVDSYKSYFSGDGVSDEDAVTQTKAYLESAGLTVDVIKNDLIKDYISEQLYSAVTADVTVSDEEIQAEYEALIAENQQDFTDDYTYNSARSAEETIAWNPEGYRAVKHVLIKFNDEQSTLYNDLQSTLSSLNDELKALDEAEEAAEASDEAVEESVEEVEVVAEDAGEEVVEEAVELEEAAPRPREEIQSDIGNVGKEIEALYSELLPKAQEVIEAFKAGTDFDTLIEQYGEDPGMTTEPSKTQGYAVSADSTYWDSAFTEGAMSIGEIGQISAPVYGSYGIHIIYYMSDITPGEVPFEDIADGVKAAALDNKISQAYDDQVSAWVEEAAPVYHLDRF